MFKIQYIDKASGEWCDVERAPFEAESDATQEMGTIGAFYTDWQFKVVPASSDGPP
jgi:hypothetical protein